MQRFVRFICESWKVSYIWLTLSNANRRHPSTPRHCSSKMIRLRDAKNIQAYCTCNITFKVLMKLPYLESSVALCNGSTGPGSGYKLYTHFSMSKIDMHLTKSCSKFGILERKFLYKTRPSLGGYCRGCYKENSAVTVMQRFARPQYRT